MAQRFLRRISSVATVIIKMMGSCSDACIERIENMRKTQVAMVRICLREFFERDCGNLFENVKFSGIVEICDDFQLRFLDGFNEF